MSEILNEAFKVSRTKDLRGNPIAFIDPNAPENNNTFAYKNIFKDSGAQWSSSPKFKNIFPPHKTGFWFWFIGKTEDQWRIAFDKRIKPALEKVHGLEGATEEDSKSSLVASLDAMIEKIKTAEPDFDNEAVLTKEDKQKILDKLSAFKESIVNIKDDEEFKATMKKIIAWKSSQGHKMSLGNTILALVQRPKAKLVKSKSVWLTYNRMVNKGAMPIFLWKPSQSAMKKYTKGEKDTVVLTFLKSIGKKSVGDLTPQERERLNVKTAGKFLGGRFDLYDSYDIEDTTLMEGQEDLVAPSLSTSHDIPWSEDNMLSDEVKPVYSALIDYAKQKGIDIELAGDEFLQGAKGMSSSGKIYVLNNNGDDIGLTKTLAHELAHEILHQTYLKSKDDEMKQYFVGNTEGRHMVEQQAELTAWMVLAAFGFDLKTTSLNYVALWGGRADSMVKVFDTVANAANLLISEVTKRNVQLKEDNVDVPTGVKHYTADDVANMLGVQDEFHKAIEKERSDAAIRETLLEDFRRLSGSKKII